MNVDWLLLGFRVAAALILYSFLGLAFYIIWRDLQTAAAPVGLSAEAQLRMLDTDRLFPLKAATFLGRGPENDIVISNPAASVRHARLDCANGTWWLEDLGSKNGITLNDLPLSKPVTLTDGDVIGIGQTRLRFETN